MIIGTDHSILMILLVCRHMGRIFHYSVSGRQDRRLFTGRVGTPLEEIAVGRISESSWVGFQGQTVFALCSDKLNSWKDTSLYKK